MKPILFPAGQTSFNTNGLDRLTDAISCIFAEFQEAPMGLSIEERVRRILTKEEWERECWEYGC